MRARTQSSCLPLHRSRGALGERAPFRRRQLLRCSQPVARCYRRRTEGGEIAAGFCSSFHERCHHRIVGGGSPSQPARNHQLATACTTLPVGDEGRPEPKLYFPGKRSVYPTSSSFLKRARVLLAPICTLLLFFFFFFSRTRLPTWQGCHFTPPLIAHRLWRCH